MVTRKWYSLYHGERQAYATKPVNGGWAVIRVTAHASKGGVCEVSESNLVVVVGDERYTTQDGAASDTFVSPQNQLGGTLPLRDGEKQDGLVLVDAPVNGAVPDRVQRRFRGPRLPDCGPPASTT